MKGNRYIIEISALNIAGSQDKLWYFSIYNKFPKPKEKRY